MPALSGPDLPEYTDRRHEAESLLLLHDERRNGGDAMRKILTFIMAVLMISASTAQAETGPTFMTGNKLVEFCKAPDGICIGYITGIADYVSQQPNKRICLPLTSTVRQLTEVVNQWLKDNPQHLHYAAAGLIELALYEAFSCK
jgi:hypothetical protein